MRFTPVHTLLWRVDVDDYPTFWTSEQDAWDVGLCAKQHDPSVSVHLQYPGDEWAPLAGGSLLPIPRV